MMQISVNLRPWRIERRLARAKSFSNGFVVAMLVGVLLAYGVYWGFGSATDAQNERNAFIDTEIRKLQDVEKQMQEMEALRKDLDSRFTVLNTLNDRRAGMVRVLNNFAKNLPKEVFLAQFVIEGNQLNLNGVAPQGRRELVGLINALKVDDLFQEPRFNKSEELQFLETPIERFEMGVPIVPQGRSKQK